MKLYKALLVCSFLSSLFVSNSVLALDCQNPQTQTDMNQCASTDLDRETKRINKTYNNFRAKLNTTQKQQFKVVQLAWIKFKDLACKFEASGVEGGSAHSMVLAGCLTEKTRQRNKELETLGNCQEGDLSCPAW
ncbi:MAG: lysozyme inhibitor LprI family protein [Methylophilaceae bacterium]